MSDKKPITTDNIPAWQTDEPVVMAEPEPATAAGDCRGNRHDPCPLHGPTCPQCLHAWHGRRVCGAANCCSCRLTWREVLRGRR